MVSPSERPGSDVPGASAPVVQSVEAGPQNAGERLDRLVTSQLQDLSRSRVAALIRGGHVAGAGGTIREPSRRVKLGERFEVTLPPPHPSGIRPEAIPLDVVYEDDDLIVINKPTGLVVHPAPGHVGGTLVNALLAHVGDGFAGIGGEGRPGIVHRLDKDTTGLMVVAKTDRAHRCLADQFADHGRTGALERSYLAFVWGVPPRGSGTIDRPVGRHPTDRLKQAIRKSGGRHAVTHYRVLQRFAPESGKQPIVSQVCCRLETGRTHQVRVHMAAILCPLLGDRLYGAGFRTKASLLPENARKIVESLDRQALHAATLAFTHPADGRVLRFDSPLPPDLKNLALSLNFDVEAFS